MGEGSKEACTYDVRTEGEGGWPKSDQRKGGCVDLVLTTRGEALITCGTHRFAKFEECG